VYQRSATPDAFIVPDPAKTHVRALDGMRGAAVLAVIAFHYLVFGAGWAGVQMFFVLSGFLITSILLEERDSPFAFYLKRFYWRRSLRIFPLYFACIGVIAIATAMALGPAAAFLEQWPYLLTYTFNHACLWRECIYPWYWDHLWSLSVEEQFYLIWPALIFFLSRRALGWVLVGIVVATPFLRLAVEISFPGRIAGHRIGAIIYMLTACQLDAFACGALVAYMPRHARVPNAVRLWRGASVALLAAGLANQWAIRHAARLLPLTIGFPVNAPFNYQSSWGYTLVNLWSATLVMTLLQENAVARFFRWGPLAHVGKISYGVYIFHLPILVLARRHLGFFYTSTLLGQVLVFALYLAVTLAVSQVSYVWFERRFLALKNTRFVRPAKTDIGEPSTVAAKP
jgi:peptidoglycan/LPS O-acetylase OafA/YrhL